MGLQLSPSHVADLSTHQSNPIMSAVARLALSSPANKMLWQRTLLRQAAVSQARAIQTSAQKNDIDSVFSSLIIGYARNPSLKQQLFSYAILGFALSEAMGLFCLMVAFVILFAL